MKFDVIISNPPYQMNDGGNGISAKPIYQLFIQQAKKLNPNYLTMIIPSRWFSGGKGLDAFRKEMLSDEHITKITDFINAKDCFPTNSIAGGVCYFLREKNEKGMCEFTSIRGKEKNTCIRKLDEYPVLIRYNEALSIVHKTQYEQSFSEIISTRNPFGIPSNGRGIKQKSNNDYNLYSKDDVTFLHPEQLAKNIELANQYKIMISRFSADPGGEPDKDGMMKVLSRTELLKPKDICTDTYIVAGGFAHKFEAENVSKYLKTKFVRFLLLLSISSINITKQVFSFVPMQDFTKPWTDKELYEKYKLTDSEISFIESMIKPMNAERSD